MLGLTRFFFFLTVDAIRTFINRFPSASHFDALHCQNSSNLEPGAEIRCDCIFKDNKSNITCHITEIDLSFNFFNQQIPAAFGNLSLLQYLILDDNMLSGPIPDELGNLTQLWSLFLDENELNGPLPPGLGKLSNLAALDLSFHDLRNVPNVNHENETLLHSPNWIIIQPNSEYIYRKEKECPVKYHYCL
ncbi:receptor-like protein 33 isoform X2 [Jatropha curcas]|uniref:receptor-like protein 33 isoform X2 n=1 Tax=Jatropha curcas TaxID=180498 RepID=UPI0018958FF0|nr:receptor-like protein 33 isoform X2 [Jatropha curcas]